MRVVDVPKNLFVWEAEWKMLLISIDGKIFEPDAEVRKAMMLMSAMLHAGTKKACETGRQERAADMVAVLRSKSQTRGVLDLVCLSVVTRRQ